MPIELICLDADDTLWHNMRHFDATEAIFADLLAPFAEAGVSREQLNSVEIRNLKLYGYGAKSFTLSMIETALELAGDRLTDRTVADILAAGRQLLAHPVELLPGIEEALDVLGTQARLVLVTKGDLLHQETKLAASGLGERFSAVEIVSDKTPDTFHRLFARHGVAAERVVMAGDSLRSDVVPALSAGAFAAYVPHDLVWEHERADEPVGHERYRRLSHLAHLGDWIATL
jgi:putative hydrolase of the HAD superfamily